MSKKSKKIVILTEVELRKTISRLTCEIIEKVKKLDNLLLIGIPTRGVALTEVLEKELFSRTGLRVRKGTIDPTFYRDDQNRVGTRLIQAADIPTPIEKKEILLIDDVIYTGRTIRAAIDALFPISLQAFNILSGISKGLYFQFNFFLTSFISSWPKGLPWDDALPPLLGEP